MEAFPQNETKNHLTRQARDRYSASPGAGEWLRRNMSRLIIVFTFPSRPPFDKGGRGDFRISSGRRHRIRPVSGVMVMGRVSPAVTLMVNWLASGVLVISFV